MDVFVIGWIFMGAVVVADNRRLRKDLAKQKEHVRHCTQTLGRRVAALEASKEVWDRMLLGVVQSTN